MTVSKIFLFLCLSFIAGIFLASFFNFTQIIILSLLIFVAVLISVFWKRKRAVVFGFCILFLVLGIFRQQTAINSVPDILPQEVSLFVQVVAEPIIKENHTKLVVAGDKGKILLTTNRYPEYQYGDRLEINGNLEVPTEFEGFNYKDYLLKDGIYAVMYNPRIKLLDKEFYQGSFEMKVYAKILEFKQKLKESIKQNLSPPYSSILGAIILGDKSRFSEELKNKLNITGLRHITCISGMHIIILSGILMGLGIALGFWRGQAFYFTLVLLIVYIIMIGAPPSAVRAGIMAGLLLFAQKIGRFRAANRALVFAAVLMLAINPFLLKNDVGFPLSFLATLGIIYFLPFFQNWFKWLPLKDIISLTLAAQVFTLPLLIYNFGYISLVAPLTNLLIVPLLPLIMILGFVFVLSGLVWQPLAWLLSLPLQLLLAYMVKIIDCFVWIPFASVNLEISWSLFFVFYLFLGWFAWYLDKKQKLKFLDY